MVADRPLSPGALSLFRRWYPVNCVVSVREACFVPGPDFVLVAPRAWCAACIVGFALYEKNVHQHWLLALKFSQSSER